MDKSWANVIQNFNKKFTLINEVFLGPKLAFIQNFVSFCLVNDRNILPHANIAVTY